MWQIIWNWIKKATTALLKSLVIIGKALGEILGEVLGELTDYDD